MYTKQTEKWIQIHKQLILSLSGLCNFSIGGAHLIRRIISPFSSLLFSWAGQGTVEIITSLGIWSVMWYMFYWLYKNKIYVKI